MAKGNRGLERRHRGVRVQHGHLGKARWNFSSARLCCLARGGTNQRKSCFRGQFVGRKLALYVSATCDDAVDGIVLLNATPFWGFLKKRIGFLNKENDVLVRLTQLYWDTFRSKENVRRLLNMVYADETKIEESLIDDIIEPTENEFAIRAFISTFTSPKASKMSYDEMLETIRDRSESLRVGLVRLAKTRGSCRCGDKD